MAGSPTPIATMAANETSDFDVMDIDTDDSVAMDIDSSGADQDVIMR
jgi:hypothetical protein